MTPPLPPSAVRSDRIESTPDGSLQLRLEDALFVWKRTEPVRLYLYGVLAAVLVVLAVVGLVTQDLAAAITGVAAAVLVAVPGAAAVRASVVSPATYSVKRQEDAARWAAAIRAGRVDEYGNRESA